MMSRGEFLKEGRQRLSYLLQQIEREAAVRAAGPKLSQLEDAQIKLSAAKAEFLDFFYDRFAELEGSLITPARSAPSEMGIAAGGSAPSEREPNAINSEPRL